MLLHLFNFILCFCKPPRGGEEILKIVCRRCSDNSTIQKFVLVGGTAFVFCASLHQWILGFPGDRIENSFYKVMVLGWLFPALVSARRLIKSTYVSTSTSLFTSILHVILPNLRDSRRKPKRVIYWRAHLDKQQNPETTETCKQKRHTTTRRQRCKLGMLRKH